MNEKNLASIDDAALENVNGGLGLAVTVNERTWLGIDVDLDPRDGKIGTKLTLFGIPVEIGLGFNWD